MDFLAISTERTPGSGPKHCTVMEEPCFPSVSFLIMGLLCTQMACLVSGGLDLISYLILVRWSTLPVTSSLLIFLPVSVLHFQMEILVSNREVFKALVALSFLSCPRAALLHSPVRTWCLL